MSADLHNRRMATIDTVLRSEISRLARKQVRAEIEPLKKAALQHRRHVASLRRQVEALEREINRFAKAGKRMRDGSADGSQVPSDERPLRFRASGLASHRKRLGLSAADFGKLLGVSGQSVYKWETGEVRPRRSQLEAIAAIRKLGRREALARLNAGA